jgi:hypothetical protein
MKKRGPKLVLVFVNLLQFLRLYPIEISVKSRKDSTSTLSLVIHRVRLKNYLPKNTLAFKDWGVKLRNPSILMVF